MSWTKNNSAKLTMLFAAHHAEVLAYCVRRIGYAEGEDAAAEVFAVAHLYERLSECQDSTE